MQPSFYLVAFAAQEAERLIDDPRFAEDDARWENVAELYDEAARKHGFRFDRSSLSVALNHAVVPWTAEIHDGDTVAFLAPFAGG